MLAHTCMHAQYLPSHGQTCKYILECKELAPTYYHDAVCWCFFLLIEKLVMQYTTLLTYHEALGMNLQRSLLKFSVINFKNNFRRQTGEHKTQNNRSIFVRFCLKNNSICNKMLVFILISAQNLTRIFQIVDKNVILPLFEIFTFWYYHEMCSYTKGRQT